MPKKELKIEKDGTFYRRPHGASPAGFDWDAIRGVWKPGEVSASTINVLNNTTPIPPKKTNGVINNEPMCSDVNDIRLVRVLKKGFIVDGDGCILPKKVLSPDPSNPRLYKRPRGASPGKYQWNPIRGVWQPHGITQVKQKVSRKSTPSTIEPTFTNDDDGNASSPNTEPSESRQKVWKGFRVLENDCLVPKKPLKSESNAHDGNRQLLWRRPQGSAPNGYNWNNIRGVWEPSGTEVMVLDNNVNEITSHKAISVTASLSDGPEITEHVENTTIQSSGINPDDDISENQGYYPKRKRIKLQRYTPPLV